MKPVHPFPARMAPDLALERLALLRRGSRVLDPMVGSGTVLRQAISLGHSAIGFDMDPLAVLMAKVWTTPVADVTIAKHASWIIDEARAIDPQAIRLPWIDDDAETTAFIKYWFGEPQVADLRRIAFALDKAVDSAATDVMRLALSRIIVTKEQSASLARDTSHSRPHKVAETTNFQVFPAFEKSVRLLRKRLADHPAEAGATVALGDARKLVSVENSSIDAVLTSPPYLNAIDYLRGHRMSLVWLGRGFGELRRIRSNSIGAERAPNEPQDKMFDQIKDAMGSFDTLPRRYGAMIDRYSEDLYRMVSEVARVLAPGGTATFVVGNSCLKGTFVENSAGVAEAARMMGLTALNTVERALPENKRYLPINAGGSLGKRMRTETICSFAR
jgi:DNA modification methylase